MQYQGKIFLWLSVTMIMQYKGTLDGDDNENAIHDERIATCISQGSVLHGKNFLSSPRHPSAFIPWHDKCQFHHCHYFDHHFYHCQNHYHHLCLCPLLISKTTFCIRMTIVTIVIIFIMIVMIPLPFLSVTNPSEISFIIFFILITTIIIMDTNDIKIITSMLLPVVSGLCRSGL